MTLGTTLPANSLLAKKAQALVPLINEHAAHGDEHGRLAAEVVDAFHRDGLFEMWVPEVLGGSELMPLDALEVISLAAYGDPSAGWVLMAAALEIGTAGSYLGDSAVAELWGDDRHPVIGGQGTRPGSAVPTEGGYLLSGSWSFASGLLHGSHTHSLAIIEPTGEPRIFVVPVEQAQLLGNWDVMGLRGTGSVDYAMDSVFVPEEYTHFAFTEEPARGGAVYKLGVIAFAEICHSGWAIGVGRRILDEIAAYARSKVGTPNARTDGPAFATDYAAAEATYRSAAALVREAWADVHNSLEQGDPLSVRQGTLIRLALNHMTASLFEIANFAYLAGGTTALRSGTMQRLMRDVHAGTQHITSGPGALHNEGLELLGMAEGKKWILLDLVDA